MSKAFTNEDAAEVDDAAVEREGPPLPEGAKNYMTPVGAARLEVELRELREQRLPALAAEVASGGAGDAAKRLREASVRARFLARRREALEVVVPPATPTDVVRFGARVTVVGEDGAKHVYRIVGLDESDAASGAVSWLSPVARALTGARPGDEVTLRAPGGAHAFEVMAVAYDPH